MPIGASASGTSVRNTNSATPSAGASHSACRNSGPISPRRPAPSSCDTDGGNAISVPIGTIIGSQNSAVPTATAASVVVPWWPAITLSTKPISPVDRWPATSGPDSHAVVRTSLDRRGRGTRAAGTDGTAGLGMGTTQGDDCSRAANRCRALAPGRGGPLS